MSFASRLIHSLAIVEPTTTGVLDDYGQPVASDPVVTLVAGLLQPIYRGREVPLTTQGGAELSSHRVYLLPQALSADAYIRFEPDDGDRYQVVDIKSFEFGHSPHLEVECKLIRSTATVGS